MYPIDRQQVLAYRIAAHGLHRDRTELAALAVFDLGVQDTVGRTAPVALTARLPEPISEQSLMDNPDLVLAWTRRGAPHYHRRSDLLTVISSLTPISEADAMARMLWQRDRVDALGMPADKALTTAARALRKVVDKEMTKGAASAALTKALPAGFSAWCRGCQAIHVQEQVMRLAAAPAGVQLTPGATPATLAPLPGRPPVPTKPDLSAGAAVITEYLRLHGPARAADVAGFIGTSRDVVDRLCPAGLAEVTVDGKRGYLPEDAIPALSDPPDPDVVRLLPAWDPLLQGRDRATLVPDRALHKEVWKILGNPGALLVDGAIAGTWRASKAGNRIAITIAPFWTLSRGTKTRIEAEANRVAKARGLDAANIKF